MLKANKRLMEIRICNGLTIAELSELSGVPPSTISRAENGQSLSVKSASKLCRVLKLEFNDLFTIHRHVKSGGKNETQRSSQ